MNQSEATLRDEYVTLQKKLQDPAIFSAPEYPKLAKRLNELSELVALFDKRNELDTLRLETEKLAKDSDSEMAAMAQEELASIKQQETEVMAALESLLMPPDPSNNKNVIMEIRAAAGGDEASLFAGELYRMYARYSERVGFTLEIVSENPSEVGGFKEIIFEIKGSDVYKQLKFEAGVHRVQRIPSTESSGRIHTSTVTVAVLPEAEETDIEINPADLRIDVYRSSGHGGQSVNTTDSAVRITHVPTGMVVTCQDEKSQIKNKAKAMGVLRSRLLQLKMDEEQKQQSDARKKLIGSGDRSEKIRTYNFPQDRITDHRIGYSRSNLPAALDGDIGDIIENLQQAEHQLLSNETQ